MKPRQILLVAILALALALIAVLTACEQAKPTAPQVSSNPVAAGVARPGLQQGTVLIVPEFQTEWSKSGHADVKAEAFNDWNDAKPPEVPATCAHVNCQLVKARVMASKSNFDFIMV